MNYCNILTEKMYSIHSPGSQFYSSVQWVLTPSSVLSAAQNVGSLSLWEIYQTQTLPGLSLISAGLGSNLQCYNSRGRARLSVWLIDWWRLIVLSLATGYWLAGLVSIIKILSCRLKSRQQLQRTGQSQDRARTSGQSCRQLSAGCEGEGDGHLQDVASYFYPLDYCIWLPGVLW